MKASQEIADEAAMRIFNESYTSWLEADWPNKALPIYMDMHIPLTQLIEVARAAKDNHKNNCNPKYCKLCAAIYALKATGKAEWLYCF